MDENGLLERLTLARNELLLARNTNQLLEDYLKHCKYYMNEINIQSKGTDLDLEIIRKIDDTSFLCEDIFLDYMIKDRILVALRQLEELISMIEDYNLRSE